VDSIASIKIRISNLSTKRINNAHHGLKSMARNIYARIIYLSKFTAYIAYDTFIAIIIAMCTAHVAIQLPMFVNGMLHDRRL